jgi:archaeosine-15-forming tRNA-guanine transglycosylase
MLNTHIKLMERGPVQITGHTFSKETDVIVTNQGRIRDILIKENDLFFVMNNTDGRGQPSQDNDKLLKLSLVK